MKAMKISICNDDVTIGQADNVLLNLFEDPEADFQRFLDKLEKYGPSNEREESFMHEVEKRSAARGY